MLYDHAEHRVCQGRPICKRLYRSRVIARIGIINILEIDTRLFRHLEVKAPSVLGRAKGHAVALNTDLPLFLYFRLSVDVDELIEVADNVHQPLLHLVRVQFQLLDQPVYLVDIEHWPYALLEGLPCNGFRLRHDAFDRVRNHHHSVYRAERASHSAGKVNVAGGVYHVYDVFFAIHFVE